MKLNLNSSITLMFFLFFLSSCYTLEGRKGTSSNIEDAKNRGVFIMEFSPIQNPYPINDTLSVFVKEAWLEQTWRYGQSFRKSIKQQKGYYLRVNSDEKYLKRYYFDWTIGLSREKYMRPSSLHSLIGDFKQIPESDTIHYWVQQGNNLPENKPKVIIGDFQLVKK